MLTTRKQKNKSNLMISYKYHWLTKIEGLPKIIVEAIKLGRLDTTEIKGAASNKEIMKLAKEAGVSRIYEADEVAWCAVAMVVLCLRAGKPINFEGYDRLRARTFADYGTSVQVPVLGDILVFKRDGGYHVGLYIGEDSKCYHVAGGNQSNQFNIIRIEKKRLYTARRPEYKIGMPAGCKRYILANDGIVSNNEA